MSSYSLDQYFFFLVFSFLFSPDGPSRVLSRGAHRHPFSRPPSDPHLPSLVTPPTQPLPESRIVKPCLSKNKIDTQRKKHIPNQQITIFVDFWARSTIAEAVPACFSKL